MRWLALLLLLLLGGGGGGGGCCWAAELDESLLDQTLGQVSIEWMHCDDGSPLESRCCCFCSRVRAHKVCSDDNVD